MPTYGKEPLSLPVDLTGAIASAYGAGTGRVAGQDTETVTLLVAGLSGGSPHTVTVPRTSVSAMWWPSDRVIQK